ncbi:MAG: NAD-dependent epimerase/dehydratase family protein, partial [Fibrobacterota bacterium]
CSCVNVTTDKVYDTRHELQRGYCEEDRLGGGGPYSASKACSEIVSRSYAASFFTPESGISLSTARAGNVIGGGDYAENRIIPDCVRALLAGRPVRLRNPASIRPYQHVLEPICAYLRLAALQYETPSLAGSYNFGPPRQACLTTQNLAERFIHRWGSGTIGAGRGKTLAGKETAVLRLNAEKAEKNLGIIPRWSVDETIAATVSFYQRAAASADFDYPACMREQIKSFLFTQQ